MKNIPTIDEVKSQISAWRFNKKAKNENTPEEIRFNVAKLLNTHSPYMLRTELKLNATQIEKFAKDFNEATKEKHYAQPTEFKKLVLDVNIPLLATVENLRGYKLNLQLQSMDQIKIIMENFLSC